MPQLQWAIVVGGYLLAIYVIVRVILQRKDPSASLAWMLGVLLLPYLGVVAYMLFGRHRLKRQVKRRRARAEAIEPHLAKLSEGIEELTPFEAPAHLTKPQEWEMVRLTDRIGARPPTCGNKVQLFINADSAYLSMERALKKAERQINFQFYIFETDDTGKRFRDLLCEKAREGVEVRVLTDGVGSFGVADFMEPLLEAGGQFVEFLPVRISRNLHRTNLRNHRKIVIIDGKIAFTGGINIGDEYTGRKKKVGPWRDTHLRLEGPTVYHLQEVFAEDWHFATGHDPVTDDWFPDQEAVGDATVQIVASGPDTDTQPIHLIFFAAITGARKRVWLTTPYFVPDLAVRVALQSAALRGIDVRLLLPFHSDMRLVLHAGRSYYDELLEAGVRIFEYSDGILHAKTMVVDDTWATVGSSNMDIRSFSLNFEVNAAIYGPEFANELGKVFLKDLQKAQEITQAELLGHSVWRKIVQNLARMLSPLL